MTRSRPYHSRVEPLYAPEPIDYWNAGLLQGTAFLTALVLGFVVIVGVGMVAP